MIRRQCPNCGKDWYSAYTGSWKCPECGRELDDSNNVEERRDENAGSIKVRREEQ